MSQNPLQPLSKYNIILASKSPRRHFLLTELGIEFHTKTKDTAEDFPPILVKEEIPLYLSRIKAKAFEEELQEKDLVITADTIVWVDNKVLNKPSDDAEAIKMLQTLSGKMHEVYTAVCLKSKKKTRSFFAKTNVYFKNLTEQEISYYVEQFKPFDKAGAYGAQEWIGYIAVEKIEGSYFNVMGLPVKEIYEELIKF